MFPIYRTPQKISIWGFQQLESILPIYRTPPKILIWSIQLEAILPKYETLRNSVCDCSNN